MSLCYEQGIIHLSLSLKSTYEHQTLLRQDKEAKLRSANICFTFSSLKAEVTSHSTLMDLHRRACKNMCGDGRKDAFEASNCQYHNRQSRATTKPSCLGQWSIIWFYDTFILYLIEFVFNIFYHHHSIFENIEVLFAYNEINRY